MKLEPGDYNVCCGGCGCSDVSAHRYIKNAKTAAREHLDECEEAQDGWMVWVEKRWMVRA